MVLRTVVSRRPDEVRAALPGVRTVTGLAEACADPAIDLVVIPTPNATHAPLAAQALAAGKHVVVDKPFTLNLAEAEALLTQARAAGRLLSVFQNRRWDSDFLTLRRLLAADAVGVPVHFESHFDRFRPQVPDRWRDRAGPGSGLWYDFGPHLIDQALQLFGPPRAVFVDLAAQRDAATADDRFHALLRYDCLRVVLHATALAAAETPRFVLHGTSGSWVKHGLDSQEEALKAGTLPGGHGWGADPRPGRLTTPAGVVETPGVAGDYRQYYLAVRDAIACGGANPVTPDDALTVMRVLELGRRSHEERRELALDPL
jgi:predicted dehydrogenase